MKGRKYSAGFIFYSAAQSILLGSLVLMQLGDPVWIDLFFYIACAGALLLGIAQVVIPGRFYAQSPTGETPLSLGSAILVMCIASLLSVLLCHFIHMHVLFLLCIGPFIIPSLVALCYKHFIRII